MFPVSEIAEGVYVVDTGGLGYWNTVAAYVVRGSRYAAVLDTGYASGAARIVSALTRIGVEKGELRYIIVTHAHLDHCGASGDLLASYPLSGVYAHERAVPHLVDPSRLLASVRSIYSDGLLQRMGGMRPTEEGRTYVLGDGEEIGLGGLTVRAVYTPGHAPHHLSLEIVERGYVVTGDAVPSRYPFASYYIPNAVPPRYDYELALASIKKLFGLGPRLLLTPHYGPLIASEVLMEKYIEVIEACVGLARSLARGAGRVEELEAAVRRRIAGEVDPRGLHPSIRTALRFVALSLHQTYSSST
jgi:glyoxylase-like metal-dependent hydrolase (beta-lactamase superfamily II)